MQASRVMFFMVFAVLCFLKCINGSESNYKYHNNDELLQFMRTFAQNTTLTHRLFQIGRSLKGFPLTVLEIAQPGNKIGVPNVKLVANIHGDEVIGREVLLNFMKYLENNYNSDSSVKCLLDNTRISILPTMNPDGFTKAIEGNCLGNNGRRNANNYDLNRNFPDYFHHNSYGVNDETYQGFMQPETIAIMRWMNVTPFVLSASLHGGAVVVNYPYDTTLSSKYFLNEKGEALTPDNDVFVHLSRTYAKTHKRMGLGVSCSSGSGVLKAFFPDGTTNGAKWYDLKGGMQDFNYIQHGCLETTLELSCCKYPPEEFLPMFVKENMQALVNYCLQALRGIKGLVLDSETLVRIPKATLRIAGRQIPFRTSKRGEFWRILLPGTYTIKVEAQGYLPATKEVTVIDYPQNICPDTTKFTQIKLVRDMDSQPLYL